jgi:endonuclease/exonuclease/phosphatase (EEP) superfamily protein YafD
MIVFPAPGSINARRARKKVSAYLSNNLIIHHDREYHGGKSMPPETGRSRFDLESTLSGLLITGGIVVSAVSVACFAGDLHWLLDVLRNLRLQYLGSLLVISAALAACRRFRWALALLAIALVNAAPVAPLYFGGPPKVEPAGPAMRAVTMNIHSPNRDHGRVVRFIRSTDPDLLLLNEINRRWTGALRVLEDAYPHRIIKPREDDFGIALFSKLELDNPDIVYVGNAAVPSVTAGVETGNGGFTILGMHPLPPLTRQYFALRNRQLEGMARFARRTASPLLVLGDLNVTPWSRHFTKSLRAAGLLDSARGRGVQTTWPTFAFWMRIPIDHCLHAPAIRVHRRWTGPDVGSDHYPLIVDFSPPPPGTGDDQR